MSAEKENDCLLLLTHIPKCCGTSFRFSIIKPNIPEDFIFSPQNGWRGVLKNRHDYRYIVGHHEAGIESFIHPLSPARRRPKFRVTILRNPLSQMISYVAYHSEEYVDGDAVVTFYEDRWRERNMQTRMLSGFLLNRLYVHLKKSSRLVELWVCRSARHRLDSYFDYVGRLENIDEDMKRICQLLGFRYEPIYAEVTRTRNRITVDQLSARQVERLRELNYLDFRLYEYATDKFGWQQTRQN